MKTKETKTATKNVSKEKISKPKRLNAYGEWINSPDWKPFIKIIDMKAVMR
jgi:hypothetical protein